MITNETGLFIGENGARTTNNANEVAHYEFGAALASDAILDAMNEVEAGKTELELGECLNKYGQHPSLTIIAATGERFEHGNMFPTQKKVKLGDAISLTTGYAGGSSSRAGYAAKDESDIPDSAKRYINALVAPYFIAYVTWLKKIHVGMKGKEMFNEIETVLPRSEYHWSLCPGHLTAEEEWMSSPIYEGSEEKLKSGMIFQIDIIPSKSGMAGTGCESTVLLADENLKKDIQNEYPDMWDRMMKRLDYMKNVLNIPVSDDILPMCSTVAYLRPFLLNKDCAMKLEK